ncbi:toprim domain-containing protein [Sphingomonas sp. H160509]|uniref:toprim domain-containing protein n=1 Tax=Sphingomonas sp. H160509 TaxID=2955313 RepID=UPI00406D2175
MTPRPDGKCAARNTKGSRRGGDKALFWIGQIRAARRVAVTESAIDALSLATIEQWPEGTAYVSTGGGFGPPTAETFSRLLPSSCRLVAATDRGQGGDILAERLREMAAGSCAGFGRVRSSAKDWNDELRGRIE